MSSPPAGMIPLQSGPPPGMIPVTQDTPPPGMIPVASTPHAPTPNARVLGDKTSQVLNTYAPAWASNAMGAIRTAAVWAHDHQVDALLDTLSAPERFVGGVSRAMQQQMRTNPSGGNLFANLRQQLGQGFADAMNPDAQQADTEAFRAALGVPTHAAIDAWVAAHIPARYQAIAASALKGTEDFGLQTIFDPTTYIGLKEIGWFLGATRKAFQAVHALEATRAAAKAVGMGKAFEHLDSAAANAHHVLDTLGSIGKGIFDVRPDLNNFFDAEGKKARMQIEHAEYARINRLSREDEQLIKNGKGADVYQKWLYYNGTPDERQAIEGLYGIKDRNAPVLRSNPRTLGDHQESATASAAKRIKADVDSFAKISPEEQLAEIKKQQAAVRDANIALKTRQYVLQHGGVKPGVSILNIDGIPTRDTRLDDVLRKINASSIGPVLRGARELQRQAVFWNPLPHGFKNVGMLAYLRGGPGIIPSAMKYMMTGISAADRERMSKLGILPEYTSELSHSIYSKIPGWDTWTRTMQDAMNRMEIGWRKALLDKLDADLGPSRNMKDELLKAHDVVTHVGDYRNVNLLVKSFETLGGPFVAFRLGIVPLNIMRAIYHNPGRVVALLRAQQATNLDFGGPIDDMAKLMFAPDQYLLSPSSIGVAGAGIGVYNKLARNEGPPLSDQLANFASYNIPLGSLAEDAYESLIHDWWLGDSTQAQNMSFGEKMMSTILRQFAIYAAKQESYKALRYERGRARAIERNPF